MLFVCATSTSTQQHLIKQHPQVHGQGEGLHRAGQAVCATAGSAGQGWTQGLTGNGMWCAQGLTGNKSGTPGFNWQRHVVHSGFTRDCGARVLRWLTSHQAQSFRLRHGGMCIWGCRSWCSKVVLFGLLRVVLVHCMQACALHATCLQAGARCACK